jgi:hypothetical protein
MPEILSYIESVKELTAPALTVRAQAISPNDNGELIYDIFFPRQNVGSVKLRDITIRNFRPAADRREWNGRGRLIPIQTPDKKDLKIIPVEDYSKIDEEEMQELFENTDGEAALIRRRIGASIPERVDNLTKAVYRRVELDAMSVWSNGYVDQVDPQTGRAFRTSFQIAASKLQTALTAWNDGSLNAYNELLAWLRDGISVIGPIEGVMLRLATQNAIQADAPTLLNGYRPTIKEISQRITDELGSPFNFFQNEKTIDVFTDGGITTTPTKTWPEHKINAIPAGKRVGATAYAPVVRAGEMANEVPEARIDKNSIAVFYEPENGGRTLTIEAQGNILSIPDEQKVWGIDVGV